MRIQVDKFGFKAWTSVLSPQSQYLLCDDGLEEVLHDIVSKKVVQPTGPKRPAVFILFT